MKQNFGDLYRKLYDENKAELEQLRLKSKEETKKIIGYVLGFFALFIILGITGTGVFLIPVIFIFAIIAMIKGTSVSKIKESPTYKYRTLFKEKIMVPLITNVFEGATYNPDAGWTPAQYKEAGYRDWIDRYSSEDLIIAPMKLKDGVETKMEFCEVHTERESRDSDGDTSYTTIFYGLASKMKIDKNIGTEVYIKRNWSAGKSKVKLDSPEFEKKFDVEAEDQIMAVRLLTADVMAEMVDMYEKYKYSFEIHVIRDTIYMRVYTGEVFEPNIFKDSMEYQTLEKYYNVIEAMMSLSKHIYKVIDEIIV